MDSTRSVYKTFGDKGNKVDNVDLSEMFLVVPQQGDAEFLADKYEDSCRRSCNCFRQPDVAAPRSDEGEEAARG